MQKFSGLIYFLLLSLVLISCNKQVSDAVEELPKISIPKYGEDNTLEIACWNIEQFPKHAQTVSDVKNIILDQDIDLYAVEEINDVNSFNNLLDSLNTAAGGDFYGGRLNELSSFLKTGIIFKKTIVEVLDSTYLFVNDLYDFASRPPYQLYLRARKNNKEFDFNLIVVHLKAEDGNPQSQIRRKNSIQKLQNYIQSQLQQPGSDPDYIIAGDWNDKLEDPTQDNVFLPFLSDTADYRFLTEPFAGSKTEYSYIAGSFKSLIDHIMITTSIDSAYPGIKAKILKVDETFTLYLSEVSDHRPVASKIPVF